MLNSILAPLDGSPAAEAGLNWTRHAAARCQAAIDLLTVVDPDISEADGHVSRAEEYLRSQGDDIEADGLTANLEVVTGPPGERILDRAASADLTVMTYGTSRWLFGGALDLVLRNMTRPLIVVRARSSHSRESPDVSKVLVPIDTVPYSRDALPAAQRLAEALGASIVLCHIIEPVGPYLDPANASPGIARIIEDMMAEGRAFLSGVARDVARKGTAVETVVAMGDAPRQIVDLVERSQAGVVAMATRGTQSLSRVMGSVAYGVLQLGHVPCLLVRPTEAHPDVALGAVGRAEPQ